MIPVLLGFIVIAVVLLIKFFANLSALNKKLEQFVCPPDNFLVGHALKFPSTTTIIPVLADYAKNYGGLVRLNIGFCFPFLLITDTKLLEHILTSTKLIEKSTEYGHLYNWLGTGLLTSPGHKWVHKRKIITPAFHFQILEQFIDVFNNVGDTLIKKLSKSVDKEINIYDVISLYTLDVICESSMGTTVNALENADSEYVRSVKEVGRIVALRGFDPLKMCNCTYIFTRDYWKERKAVRVIHAYTDSVIQKRKQQLKHAADGKVAEVVDNFGRKKRLAFLDLLMQSNVNGRPFTDEEIKEEVNTFMFAGHDTTTTAISFILYCLSNHSEIQEKVIKELQDIYADDKSRPISYQDLQEMKYLEMVIKESLRLYPPASMFAREALEDETYYAGILPKEIPLAVFSYGLHRNPDVFPDPEKFDPERFTVENQVLRNPFSYLPFSAGPRNCIGQRFAMFEMKATVAKILRKFKVLPVPVYKIILVFEIVLKSKNGIYVKLENRDF